jgi:hypothetical protein
VCAAPLHASADARFSVAAPLFSFSLSLAPRHAQRVSTRAELDAALAYAGERVVVLELVSDRVCDPNAEPRPEAQWKDDENMAPCAAMRGGLQRVSRDCPDVLFLSLNGACLQLRALRARAARVRRAWDRESLHAPPQPLFHSQLMPSCDMLPFPFPFPFSSLNAPPADDEASSELCAELDVSVFPTIQFYRAGALLWQTCGHDSGLQDAAEGVLYFADAAAVRATRHTHKHTHTRLNLRLLILALQALCTHSRFLHPTKTTKRRRVACVRATTCVAWHRPRACRPRNCASRWG